ncbi:MAG: FAD-dependent oxidoreductase [Rhodothermales bacterium]|nr:FAD-dependent oxidoreductase [Rhodothermales bacterium]MBO6781540.1 FAD-dependent oxidoreductase [Rhodothermales bacterium]
MPQSPLRVAIVGAGPAGFYAAEHVLKNSEHASVDLFDRLPTPFGLVRAGVAPDHQKIKNVTRVYDRTAARHGFRFFGDVDYGSDVSLADLRRHYHAIVFTTGAQIDRRLGIPGEDLPRSHSATEFVAWYNGHPDFRDLQFDLNQKAAVIVGVGNVAVDVARILCRTHEELATTDIADYALEALRDSRIEDVYVLGRRGPSQAAFTNPEAKELGELEGADLLIKPEEAEPDPLSRAEMEANPDRQTDRKVEMIRDYAGRSPSGKPRRLHLRFLVSPTSIDAGEDGGVGAVRIVRNEIYRNERGTLRPRATSDTDVLEAGLVFRSVGYRGVALPDVPFRDDWGIIRNEDGRIQDESGAHVPGLYTAGWIKRGPSGVIGTNKACAVGTVDLLLADAEAGLLPNPESPSPEAAAAMVAARKPDFFDFAAWQRLDGLETQAGEASGRPRVKFTTREEMRAALG